MTENHKRKKSNNMVPFFVADRPMSLRLIKGLPLINNQQACVGIMAHANTTTNFQKAFRDYPCDNLDFCDAVGTPCPHRTDLTKCHIRDHILSHTIKMCDSGIFTREGATLTYERLFALYYHMRLHYGIMIDVLGDADATIASGREALIAYEPYQNEFNLVGVAQGDSLEAYLRCYQELRDMGFTHVAVGGLLRKRSNTVRFPYVANESFMIDVLTKLREQYPDDWLFALGCLHPKRIDNLLRLGVWADSKGWIFQYEKRDATLNTLLNKFSSNHLQHVDLPKDDFNLKDVQTRVEKRQVLVKRIEKVDKQLAAGKRSLRHDLALVANELEARQIDIAKQFSSLSTHALLDAREEKLVMDALRLIQIPDDHVKNTSIKKNIQANRQMKDRLNKLQEKLSRENTLLVRSIARFTSHYTNPDTSIYEAADGILRAVGISEQAYRMEQVRQSIEDSILTKVVV